MESVTRVKWTPIQVATFDFIKANAGTSVPEMCKTAFPGRAQPGIQKTVAALKRAGFVGECAARCQSGNSKAIGFCVLKERV